MIASVTPLSESEDIVIYVIHELINRSLTQTGVWSVVIVVVDYC